MGDENFNAQNARDLVMAQRVKPALGEIESAAKKGKTDCHIYVDSNDDIAWLLKELEKLGFNCQKVNNTCAFIDWEANL